MKVRALSTGIYQNKRRREGDVFVLRPYKKYFRDHTGKKMQLDPKTKKPKFHLISVEKQFSERWMEKVDSSVEETSPRSMRRFDKNNVLEDGSVVTAPPEAPQGAAKDANAEGGSDQSGQAPDDDGGSGQDVI